MSPLPEWLGANYDGKMDEGRFRSLLHLGLGRPVLYAREHDVDRFRDVILDACLHCYAYDPQIEGTRADYMLELVALTPNKDFYYDGVLKVLPGSGDDWDAEQRFRIAACLAMDGNDRAKRVMYESFSPGPKSGEGIGINFLQIDGTDGFLFAAEKIGTLLQTTSEKVNLGLMMSVAGEILGEEKAERALREAGAHSSEIETYRLANEDGRARSQENARQLQEIMCASYEQLRSRMGQIFQPWLASWGERASDADIERAVHGLAVAQTAKEQHSHLRIFSRRRFPGDIRPLLNLVNVEEEHVGLAAIIALSKTTDPAVRELAFRLVNTSASWRGQAIELLLRNFEPGDHLVALQWFEAEDDAQTRHSMGNDLMDLCETHPDKGAEARMMRALYEEGPCSFCRCNAVRKLAELNALGDDLRTECAYDSNGEIRELVKRPTLQQSET